MCYGLHPSNQLRQLFEEQEFPHQGQDPQSARIVVIALDANYSPEISEVPNFFKHIIEYHADGVLFWEKYRVHHPFLLSNYPLKKNTGGVPYHRRFGWMNLGPEYARHISFLELLDVPTTGRTEWSRFWEIFNIDHARRIDGLVTSGEPRLVILSKTLVSTYMAYAKKTWPVFDWLPDEFNLGAMTSIRQTVIFGAPHFSSTSYKKEIFLELGDKIRDFCSTSQLE